MKISFILLCVAAFASPAFSAELSWLPGNRHHQYLTHGLFIDKQTTFAVRDAGGAWGSLGGSLAVAEVSDMPEKPQFILHGTIDSSFKVFGGPLDLKAETFDTRIGVTFDYPLTKTLRFSVGYTHISGHAADGLSDAALYLVGLSRDVIEARAIYDYDNRFRVGVTFTPVIAATPTFETFGANQFAEWFPVGAKDSPVTMTPYLAAGLEEYGTAKLDLSWHIQAGVYYGSHLVETSAPMVRIVVGYYHGSDLRLKPAVYRGSTVKFPYLGIMLHL